MDDTDIPYKFVTPWGSSAASGYVTNPIPAVSAGAAAGQDLGFPPITATPTGAGGVPPDIDDFNGAFYYATAWLQWLQAGGPVFYDSGFSAAIGGYPKGAVLASASFVGVFWYCLVDNNTSNPDSAGANWESISSGRQLGPPILVTASGVMPTLPPSTAMVQIFLIGAGGGGGSADAIGGGNVAAGGGGNSGSYLEAWVTAGFAAGTFIIGSGGASETAGGNSLFTTTVGPVIYTAPGGNYGLTTGSVTAATVAGPQVNTAPTGGYLKTLGVQGQPGLVLAATTNAVIGGSGGAMPRFGSGGPIVGSGVGQPGTGFGAGGSGAANHAPTSILAGGAGADGCALVIPYSG